MSKDAKQSCAAPPSQSVRGRHAIARGHAARIAALSAVMLSGYGLAGIAGATDHIAIGAGDCDAGVHLVAQHAALTDVLKRLSEALDFELQLAGSSDSVVDVDVSRPAPELLAKLSPSDNIIVTQGRDPRCPGQSRVVKVWMLPKAGSTAGPAGARSAAMTPAASRVAPPRQLSEAEKRQIQSGEDAYRRMHGMPPLPPQDDASK